MYLFDKSHKRFNLKQVKFDSCSRNDALNIVNHDSRFTILQHMKQPKIA